MHGDDDNEERVRRKRRIFSFMHIHTISVGPLLDAPKQVKDLK